ncbi:MAG: hypothetical protein M0031_01950 [Thermaerobacter sp.]|nr:hypothetical protein [Thermaerobacter sp.]
MFARILAVVDAYDAVISERSYHPPRPPAEAVEHIRDQAGAHFDPEVADMFLDALAKEADAGGHLKVV